MREILFGTCVALAMAVSTVVAAAWPTPGAPVAALFPRLEARDALAAVSAADGQLLDVIGSPVWIVSVSGDRGYVRSLYGRGAWLVIDARMAELCFGNEARTDA